MTEEMTESDAAAAFEKAKMETEKIIKEKYELEMRILDTFFSIGVYELRENSEGALEKTEAQLGYMLRYREAIESRLDFIFKD